MIFFGLVKVIIGVVTAVLAFPLLTTVGPAALCISLCAGFTIGGGITDMLGV